MSGADGHVDVDVAALIASSALGVVKNVVLG
jgi:hypothetical protein